jgi:hypothetical protein
MDITLGLGFGGVLANIEGAFAAHMSRRLGMQFEEKYLRSLDMAGFYGIQEDRLIYERGLFMRHWDTQTTAYPDARSAIEILNRSLSGSHFVIITTLPTGVKHQIESWLAAYYPGWMPTLVFAESLFPFYTNQECRTKRSICKELGIDLFIEANPIRAQQISMQDQVDKGTHTILMQQYWNKLQQPLNELHSKMDCYWNWEHILQEVRKLSEASR